MSPKEAYLLYWMANNPPSALEEDSPQLLMAIRHKISLKRHSKTEPANAFICKMYRNVRDSWRLFSNIWRPRSHLAVNSHWKEDLNFSLPSHVLASSLSFSKRTDKNLFLEESVATALLIKTEPLRCQLALHC